MMTFLKKIIIMTILLSLSISSYAVDLAAAKKKSIVCVACHGANGIGTAENYPNLAGQKAPYLFKQLQDFKSGVRKDTLMNAMVQNLSEDDMRGLASYYSAM